MQMKLCKGCNTTRPIEDFHRNKKNRDSHDTWCKFCARKRGDEWAAKNRKYVNLMSTVNRHKISLEEFLRLRLEQPGCFICQRLFSDELLPKIDHNHQTEKVRGLLCNDCNHALGMIKDDVERAYRMYLYLEYHSQPSSVAADAAQLIGAKEVR